MLPTLGGACHTSSACNACIPRLGYKPHPVAIIPYSQGGRGQGALAASSPSSQGWHTLPLSRLGFLKGLEPHKSDPGK